MPVTEIERDSKNDEDIFPSFCQVLCVKVQTENSGIEHFVQIFISCRCYFTESV